MKRTHLFLLILGLAPVVINAQLTPEERIQDSVIGWWSVLPKKAATPANNNGYTFTVTQQENLNEIIRWMYKTYTPVAGLGTFKKNFDADLGAQKRYPPHYYGVEFRVWDVSFANQWLTPEGKFKPIDEQYTSFFILANAIPENKPIIFVNNTDRYVFTMLPDGSGGEQLKEQRKESDSNIHSNVYPFLKYKSDYQNIYLVPGNKLPITTVSKGELLNMAESSIETLLKTELERVKQQFSNSKAQQDAFAYRKKDIEQYRTEIQKLRNKHKTSLDQPAVVNNPEITIRSFSASSDPFEISDNQKQWKQYFTVHQYTKELLAKCRTDKPQWIVISFPFITKDRGNQLTEMYKAMTENFNYEYVFNYFFSPEKVKGKYYKPANEEQLIARLNAYRKKGMGTASITNTSTSPNILLADDFSKNSDGTNAKGWKMSTAGEHSTITTLNNETGKWLKLGYNNLVSPFTLKKPLPQNFSVNFDIATDEFSSRTGGAVVLYMSTYPLLASGAENKAKDGAWLKLTIRAGNENDLNNNNYSGEAKLELHSNPPLFRENFSEGAFYTKNLTEFSSKKRKVQVQLRFNNGEIQLFINNIKVAVSGKDMKLAYGSNCKDCRVPEGLLFNTISWENLTNNAKETGVYISNIKIIKE